MQNGSDGQSKCETPWQVGAGFRHGLPEHRHARRGDQACRNIDQGAPPCQVSDAEQERQDNDSIDGVWSGVAVREQGEAGYCGQGREWRVLLDEFVKISRDPLTGRCVQPPSGGQEICDVVVLRRNGEPAGLLR